MALAAQEERQQTDEGEPASDTIEITEPGNRDEARRNQQHHRDQDGFQFTVQQDQQCARGNGIAEEDVALPDIDIVHRAEHRQRKNAPQIDADKITTGAFRARQHHGESHTE